jgi:hypothetical protein
MFGGPQASSGEDTNLALDQDKPRCISPKSLSFMFETLFIIPYACALSLQELYITVYALRSSFPIILVTIVVIVTGRWKWLGVDIGVGRRRVVERPRVGKSCLNTHSIRD